MTKKTLCKKLKDGTAFVDVTYDDFTIIHDVINDRYYMCVDDKDIKRLTLVKEVRTNDDINSHYDVDNLLKDDLDFDYDISGEFDEPIETSGLYTWRYGYFREIGMNNNCDDVMTTLIDLTDDDVLKSYVEGR